MNEGQAGNKHAEQELQRAVAAFLFRLEDAYDRAATNAIEEFPQATSNREILIALRDAANDLVDILPLYA